MASTSFVRASDGSEMCVSNHPRAMREKLDVPLSHPPRGEKTVPRFAALGIREAITRARLSLLRIFYHSRHVPQTLLKRLCELHRAGPAVAVEGRDREDKTVLPHVVGAPVAVRHHRPVSDDHVHLCRHLRDKSYLYFN